MLDHDEEREEVSSLPAYLSDEPCVRLEAILQDPENQASVVEELWRRTAKLGRRIIEVDKELEEEFDEMERRRELQDRQLEALSRAETTIQAIFERLDTAFAQETNRNSADRKSNDVVVNIARRGSPKSISGVADSTDLASMWWTSNKEGIQTRGIRWSLLSAAFRSEKL